MMTRRFLLGTVLAFGGSGAVAGPLSSLPRAAPRLAATPLAGAPGYYMLDGWILTETDLEDLATRLA